MSVIKYSVFPGKRQVLEKGRDLLWNKKKYGKTSGLSFTFEVKQIIL